MGIGSITSTNSMSAMQTSTANLKDQKSKNIQNEITNRQLLLQKLSSEEDLSANEKATERKKLQKEISGLNTKLKQHQKELLRSQKRELMLEQLREDADPAKEGQSEGRMHSNESSDTTGHRNLPDDEQKTSQLKSVITQNGDGTVILKEALNQDNNSVTDANTKQDDEGEEEVLVGKEEKAIDDDMAADTGLSGKEVHAMVSADSFLQQASRLGMIVTKTEDGIAVLKSEIKLDKNLDTDTERKEAELEKMEKRKQRAMEAQFSMLGEANNAMKPASETNGAVKDKTQVNAENSFPVSSLNMPQEEQTSQPQFYVSIR